jgi:hypothetical protein
VRFLPATAGACPPRNDRGGRRLRRERERGTASVAGHASRQGREEEMMIFGMHDEDTLRQFADVQSRAVKGAPRRRCRRVAARG